MIIVIYSKRKGVCLWSRYPSRFIGLYMNYPKVLELTLLQSHLPGENAAQFSVAEAIHTVPIVAPPGTHYCGWTEVVWIQSVPMVLTHDRHCRNRTPDPWSWSRVQRLNHSLHMYIYKYLYKNSQQCESSTVSYLSIFFPELLTLFTGTVHKNKLYVLLLALYNYQPLKHEDININSKMAEADTART